jgi:hypothetical protein
MMALAYVIEFGKQLSKRAMQPLEKSTGFV